MAQLGDDCYFFCTSICTKGAVCPFRHVESAKLIKIVCQHWKIGNCTRPFCKFRHSTFEIPAFGKSDIPCYWESQASGCTRPNCIYKHTKTETGAKKDITSEDKADLLKMADVENPAKSAGSVEIVTPQVKPVVIQPADSEDSNCSPLKRPAEAVRSDKENSAPKLASGEAIKEISSEKKENSPLNEAGKEEEKDAGKGDSAIVKESEETTAEKKPPVKKKKVVIVKKKVKKVVPKKTEDNAVGDVGTVPKKVKKVVKKVKASDTSIKSGSVKPGTAVKKVVKQKVQDAPKLAAAESGPVRKNVRDRLGVAASRRPMTSSAVDDAKKKSSGSDSDDSMENVTVMSMEEILRRKALESMMKKRMAENKDREPHKPPSPPQKSNIIKLNKPKPNVQARAPPRSAPAQRVKKRQIHASQAVAPRRNARLVPESPEESSEESSSDGEEEETLLEEEEVEQTSEDSESSSSESSDDSEDSSSDSEPSVRRVIVDTETELAARRKAKASMIAKRKQARNAAVSQKTLHKTISGRVVKDKMNREGNRLIQGALGAALGKKMVSVTKKRTIQADYESDKLVSRMRSKPLSVRDRLGKPTEMERALSILDRLSPDDEAGETHSAGEGSPRKIATKVRRSYSDGEEERDDDNDDNGDGSDTKTIKVKSLEDIKQERIGKETSSDENEEVRSLSPGKQSRDDQDAGEVIKGRQVIVADDSAALSTSPSKVEEKKAKRRPWRAQRVKPVNASMDDGGDDSRTAAVTGEGFQSRLSPPRAFDMEEKVAEAEPEVEESLFEQLKRRALMRKMQKKQQQQQEQQALALKEEQKSDNSAEKDVGNMDGAEGEEGENEGSEERSGKSRKHKHKHKHKHKKAKGERQIYVPPGMKNSVALVHPTSRVDDPTGENSNDSSDIVTESTAGQRRPGKKGPHPMAAAWTAGLSLSAKGASVRRPEIKPVLGVEPLQKAAPQTSVLQRIAKPTVSTQPIAMNEDSTDSSTGLVIKSFSEIMAEKRRRRLELQAQKSGGAATTTAAVAAPSVASTGASAQTSSPVRTESNKPRAPITPIVFDIESPFKITSQRPTATSTATNTFPQRSIAKSTMPPTVSKQSIPPSYPASVSMQSGPPLFQTEVSKSPSSGSETSKAPASSLPRKNTKKLFKKKKSVDSFAAVSRSAEAEMEMPEPTDSTNSLFGASSILDLEDDSLSLSTLDEDLEVNVGHERPSAGPNKAEQPQVLRMEPEKSAVKHKSPSIEQQVPKKKSRLSIDDELNLLEEGEQLPEIATEEQEESFDDLLQDIDDLLA